MSRTQICLCEENVHESHSAYWFLSQCLAQEAVNKQMASLKLYKSELIPQGIGGIFAAWLQEIPWFPYDKSISPKLTAVPRLCVCLHRVVWIAVLETSFFIICKHENNFSKHSNLIYCYWNAAISGCASCIAMFKNKWIRRKQRQREEKI